jgi:hypothetical protein
MKPDTRSFNTVLQGWYRSSRTDAADKAEEELDSMQSLAANIIEELSLELSLMSGRSWTDQGLIPCRRMLDALSNCHLPESVQLAEHHLDTSTGKTVDSTASFWTGGTLRNKCCGSQASVSPRAIVVFKWKHIIHNEEPISFLNVQTTCIGRNSQQLLRSLLGALRLFARTFPEVY